MQSLEEGFPVPLKGIHCGNEALLGPTSWIFDVEGITEGIYDIGDVLLPH